MVRACRDAALARVAGLLAEEDFDRWSWLQVKIHKRTASEAAPSGGAGIVAAPLDFEQPWGMSIPLGDLGDDHSSLTPGAVAHLTLKGFSVHDSKGDAAHSP